MATRLLTRFRARPVRSGLTVAFWMTVSVIVVTQFIGYLRYSSFAADLERAISIAPHGMVTDASWSFPSPYGRLVIALPVYESERALGGDLATSAVFGTSGWLRRAYVSYLVDAHAASPLIDRLADRFRAIRDERGLDSDRYLELMSTAIQAIPYGVTDDEVALPAEVLASGAGVCTDKSILLASLLVHEGYDTVVWVFPTQWHVAVGVASAHARFRGSDYALIETTGPAYVGQAALSLGAQGPVAVPPQQIPVGGTISYGSGDEVEVILRELGVARTASVGITRAFDPADLGPIRARRYAQRVLESWVASGRARYIMANTHDRRGVYRVLVLTGAEPVPAGSDTPPTKAPAPL